MTARKTSYISIKRRRGIIRHDHGYSKPRTPDSPGVAPETLYGSTLVCPECSPSISVSLFPFWHLYMHLNNLQALDLKHGSQTDTSRFCIEQIKDDKGLVHFYTGFEDYEILMICLNFLGPSVQCLQYWNPNKTSKDTQETRWAPRTLSSLNEFFLVLCRLRLGLLEQDLAIHSEPNIDNMDKHTVL